MEIAATLNHRAQSNKADLGVRHDWVLLTSPLQLWDMSISKPSFLMGGKTLTNSTHLVVFEGLEITYIKYLA